jgi:hypothetical protein
MLCTSLSYVISIAHFGIDASGKNAQKSQANFGGSAS